MFQLHNHFFLSLIVWITVANGGALRGPPRLLERELKPLQVVRLGQEFKVSCPFEGDPSPIFDWYKDGEPITGLWPRFRVNARGLRIRPVSTEDSGVYECKGVNGFGSQIARIRLIVAESNGADVDGEAHHEAEISGRKSQDSRKGLSRSASAPVFTVATLEQSGPMHLSSGNNIRFRCETKDPSSKVTWMKDGKPVGEKMWRWSSWTLTLNRLAAEDSGVYTCVGSNSQGRAEFSIQLHVTDMVEKQRPELVWGYPNNATVLSGTEAILECVVRAGHTAMPPHIKWLKRVPENQQANPPAGKHKYKLLRVENQHLFVIQESGDDSIRINETQRNGTFVSKLIFARTEAQDEGIYICLATNNIGFSYRDAHLTVLAEAEIMSSSSSLIPFPLILIGMSLVIAVVVIGAACSLRRHHDLTTKQTKSMSPRQLSNPSINYSSSSMYRKHSFEQRQLLVSTSTHSSSSSSGGGGGGGGGSGSSGGGSKISGGRPGGAVLCQTHLVSKPSASATTGGMTMSRCSCCTDKSVEISALHGYDQCFNGSYIGSTTHSLHCGHWT